MWPPRQPGIRDQGTTRAGLLKQAADKGIVGRSRMKKAELEKALHADG